MNERVFLDLFPQEPSVVDRLAALVDPAAAERVNRYDNFAAARRRTEAMLAEMAAKIKYDPMNLVGIQPMTRPIGGIAFYRPNYADKLSS